MPPHDLQTQTGRIAGKPEGQSAAKPLTLQRKVQRLGGVRGSPHVTRHKHPVPTAGE